MLNCIMLFICFSIFTLKNGNLIAQSFQKNEHRMEHKRSNHFKRIKKPFFAIKEFILQALKTTI